MIKATIDARVTHAHLDITIDVEQQNVKRGGQGPKISVSDVYLDVDNKYIHARISGVPASFVVDSVKDFILPWIKDEIIHAIRPVLTQLLPNSINGLGALRTALTDLYDGYQLDW